MENTPLVQTLTVEGPDGPMTVTVPVTICEPSDGTGAELTSGEVAFIRDAERGRFVGETTRCATSWEKRAEKALGLDRQSASQRGDLWLGGDE